MNPFKQKEVSLTSGFYFDWEKKLIVYLDVDVEDVEFASKTIYSRHSGEARPSMGLAYLLNGGSRSNPNDLYSLEVLEDVKINKSLEKDFDWIIKDESVKEAFISFLKEHELYNLLHMFTIYLQPKCEVKPKQEDCIDDGSDFPSFKRLY